jgi:hypothetical protein
MANLTPFSLQLPAEEEEGGVADFPRLREIKVDVGLSIRLSLGSK